MREKNENVYNPCMSKDLFIYFWDRDLFILLSYDSMFSKNKENTHTWDVSGIKPDISMLVLVGSSFIKMDFGVHCAGRDIPMAHIFWK